MKAFISIMCVLMTWLTAGESYGGEEKKAEETVRVSDELKAYDKGLNALIDESPPIFMRIPERVPSVDEHYHPIEVKLMECCEGIADWAKTPTPYRATHPGLKFMGYQNQDTKIGVYVDNKLQHVFDFKEGKIVFQVDVGRKKKFVRYEGMIDVKEREEMVKVLGYQAGYRYMNPENIYEGINDVPDDVQIVERHYGPAKVYRMLLSLREVMDCGKEKPPKKWSKETCND